MSKALNLKYLIFSTLVSLATIQLINLGLFVMLMGVYALNRRFGVVQA